MNSKGLELLKHFEGLQLDAYLDAVGVWTIGYGTTKNVKSGDRITEVQAEQFLAEDLEWFEKEIDRLVKVPLSEDQKAALTCFTYNVGAGAFSDSTLLRKLNGKDYAGAAEQFGRWNKGDGKELPGLTRRRSAERSLFLGQDYTQFFE